MYVDKKTKLNDEVLKSFVVNLEDQYSLTGDCISWIEYAVRVLNAIRSDILEVRLEERKKSNDDFMPIAIKNIRNRMEDIDNVAGELEGLISEIESSVEIQDSI